MSERRRRMSPLALLAVGAGLLGALARPAPVAAQVATPAPARTAPPPSATPDAPPVRLMVFSFRHQRAADALQTVRSLLSGVGSVTLEEGANSLAVRDTPAALARVSSAIRILDHEPRELLIDVQLIRAEAAKISPIPSSVGVAPDVLARLHQLFRFETFRLLARSRIAAREGEPVTYEMGDGIVLTFQPATSAGGLRLRLANFALRQAPAAREPGAGGQELVRTAVNLRHDQPVILGLTRDESADKALMLVLHYELGQPVAPAPPVPAPRRSE